MCRNCGKKGHIARVCKSKTRAQHQISSQESPQDDYVTLYPVDGDTNSVGDGIEVLLQIAGNAVKMLLDTGAALTIISERQYNESLRGLPLEPSTLRLRSYTGDAIPVLGEAQVPVTYEDQTLTLPLVVVHGDRPALLGRNWLRHIRINWSNIFSLTESAARNGLDSLLAKHKMLFSDQLGTVKGIKVAIHVKPECAPIFFKPRPLPYALREVVEKELEALEKRGTITKVDRSSWAAPIVVVPRKDKSVRLCGDYKVTVNRCIQPETYPLPSAEDLFATLAGGKYFSLVANCSNWRFIYMIKKTYAAG